MRLHCELTTDASGWWGEVDVAGHYERCQTSYIPPSKKIVIIFRISDAHMEERIVATRMAPTRPSRKPIVERRGEKGRTR